MAHTVKLTSKRQATLPVQVCRELGLKPGDELVLEKKQVADDVFWTLRPKTRSFSHWFGRLRGYASDKSHDMKDVRASIGSRVGQVK